MGCNYVTASTVVCASFPLSDVHDRLLSPGNCRAIYTMSAILTGGRNVRVTSVKMYCTLSCELLLTSILYI